MEHSPFARRPSMNPRRSQIPSIPQHARLVINGRVKTIAYVLHDLRPFVKGFAQYLAMYEIAEAEIQLWPPFFKIAYPELRTLCEGEFLCRLKEIDWPNSTGAR